MNRFKDNPYKLIDLQKLWQINEIGNVFIFTQHNFIMKISINQQILIFKKRSHFKNF